MFALWTEVCLVHAEKHAACLKMAHSHVHGSFHGFGLGFLVVQNKQILSIHEFVTGVLLKPRRQKDKDRLLQDIASALVLPPD